MSDSKADNRPSLDVVLPVLNEEKDLPPSVRKLRGFLSDRLQEYRWRIVIADNGSTDSTLEVARNLSEEYSGVGFIRLEQRGRGRALKKAWLESDADIVSYMDVDLSTDLEGLPDIVQAIERDGYDIAIGSRLLPGSHVIGRPFKRELISRAYSLIFRAMFFTGFRDAQCGFKALSRRAVDDIVPLVRDKGWFFDSELLILAEKNRFRIAEIPVTWTDDPDTRVKIFKTAYGDMQGLLRLKFGGLWKASRLLSRRRRAE